MIPLWIARQHEIAFSSERILSSKSDVSNARPGQILSGRCAVLQVQESTANVFLYMGVVCWIAAPPFSSHPHKSVHYIQGRILRISGPLTVSFVLGATNLLRRIQSDFWFSHRQRCKLKLKLGGSHAIPCKLPCKPIQYDGNAPRSAKRQI